MIKALRCFHYLESKCAKPIIQYPPSYQPAWREAVELAGAIAWSREAIADLGEYGEQTVIFQAGQIGDLE
ncbi:MAG: hypothetical protein H6887_09640 [Hoeflea sp.]|nr:hypothetical protein [Hoeflea sp.]